MAPKLIGCLSKRNQHTALPMYLWIILVDGKDAVCPHLRECSRVFLDVGVFGMVAPYPLAQYHRE